MLDYHYQILLQNPDFTGRCPIYIRMETEDRVKVWIQTEFYVVPSEEFSHEIKQIIKGAEVRFLDRHTAQRLPMYS